MQRSRTPSWDPSAERGSVPGSTKKLLKRRGTETPHLEMVMIMVMTTTTTAIMSNEHEHEQFPLLSLRTHSALTISLIPFVFTSVRKRVASLDGWARFDNTQSTALAEPGEAGG